MVSQHGRPDDGTDAAGAFNAEFFAPLKPVSEWPAGMDKDKLTAEMLGQAAGGLPRRRVQLLAVSAGQRRRGGVRRQRRELDQAVRQRPAGADRYRQQDQGRAGDRARASPISRCSPRSASRPCRSTSTARAPRARASRPATSMPRSRPPSADKPPGDVYEPGSDRHFPIVVRLAPQFRQDIEAIKNLRIGGAGPQRHRPRSRSIRWPTSRLVTGASYIYREGQQRYLPIKFSVRDRDLGSAIQEAQKKVAEQVHAAAGLAAGVGRRVRQSAGRHRAAAGRGADHARPDRPAAVGQFRLGARHAAGDERDPDGDARAACSRCS